MRCFWFSFFFRSQILHVLLLDISGRDRTNALPAFCQVFLINFSLKNHLTTKENAQQCNGQKDEWKRQTAKTDYQISCIWNAVPKTSTARLHIAEAAHAFTAINRTHLFMKQNERASKRKRKEFTGRAFVCSATYDSMHGGMNSRK